MAKKTLQKILMASNHSITERADLDLYVTPPP